MVLRDLQVHSGTGAAAAIGRITLNDSAGNVLNKSFDEVRVKIIGVSGFSGGELYSYFAGCLAAQSGINTRKRVGGNIAGVIDGGSAFILMEIAAKAMDDRLVPLMREENALVTKYENLLASAKIDWNGEKLNLSLMNPYLRNADRSVRAKAWEKYAAFFAENAEELDDLYDQLVHNRTEQAKKLGYDDYLTLGYYRMNRNCYDRKMVAEFRGQVKRDVVPFAEKIADRRRQRLGLGELSFIDEGVFSKNGNPRPIGSPEQILEAGQKMYNELSPETAKFMRGWMKDERVMIACCSDGTRPVIFKIERIDVEE